MKRFTSVAAAAIVAANLAACGPQGPAEQTVAKQNPVPPARTRETRGRIQQRGHAESRAGARIGRRQPN